MGSPFGFSAFFDLSEGLAGTRNSSVQRLEFRLDGCASTFEKGPKRKTFAQVSRILVGGEAGTIGGEFKQDLVGFTEVQTAKIEPVDFTAAPSLTGGRSGRVY